MAYSRGRESVTRYLRGLPAEIERKLLPGAARAGGKVIAAEAKENVRSPAVAAKIEVKVRGSDGHVVAKIGVADGWARSVGIWLEYGTDPHYITVDDSQRQGMSANRINRLAKNGGTLVINGTPVGKTVFHPGAQAFPFLRPALDTRFDDAVAAAQRHINSRVGPAGIAADPEGTDE